MDDFAINHVSRANNLEQQTSSYQVNRGKFFVIGRLILESVDHCIAKHEFLGSVISSRAGENVKVTEFKD